MVTDPIADFLTRLQNAFKADKESVEILNSAITRAIADVLLREGYIGESSKDKKGSTFTVALSYKSGRPTIVGAKRISKPSRRVYLGVRDIKPVKSGHGLLVLSTPDGIMTGKEARQKHTGGEVLFEIW
ncbi:30S ribosomal protein S8 [Candidatus Adlerbacteria bacterium RIFCSPHIGHO2_02_FULL_52_17]|uniref:Small ribosomal subunit protein uS8 n=1 Tax=Candidatus Adlerbacteria bacterium RIFCSPHIGHO2_02_FULL_52_17 TaxID=1797240 RepID=A0A1F4XQN8_9BACT|nr:MAG: 30S ribosomal protein S8 [Candidatus Adlerbacteria bacterium RIFCSPHIGHO2_02_FULL_52_17]